MDLLHWLWISFFGRNLAPETPVEIYMIMHIKEKGEKEEMRISQVTRSTWEQYTFLKRRLPTGDFGIGNPVVILYITEYPKKKKNLLILTKEKFDQIMNPSHAITS